MKLASGLILILLLASTLTLTFHIQTANATDESIYIRADGSVDPPTAPILNAGNVSYAFTDDIYGSIIVEKSNIIIDGKGYAVQGTGASADKGIGLSNISNVTIRDAKIRGFGYGVWLCASSNNTIYRNDIANCSLSVCVYSSSNCNRILRNNIRNCGSGTMIEASSNASIFENNITANSGIGICLATSSSYNSVFGNNITQNGWGILIGSSSSYNSVFGNNITRNGYGILLAFASNNSLTGNTVVNSTSNFFVAGGQLEDFVNNVDATNTVNGKPVYYWVDKQDMAVPPEAGYVALINCTHVKVQNLSLTRNEQGILLVHTTNSTIARNNVTNSFIGILLSFSSNHNSFFENNIANCHYEFEFSDSSDNTLYHNNFINNTEHIQYGSPEQGALWDNGCEGNYWSNYKGTDTNGDGIGDTPYIIDPYNQDNYPLMNPYWNPADINHDLKIDNEDLATAAKAYGSFTGYAGWNPHADITGPPGAKGPPDSKVDIRDVAFIAKNLGRTQP